MTGVDLAVKILGFPATIITGDTAVFDRWLWLRRHIRSGNIRTLDVGCGSGAFTLYAAMVGNVAVGISYDRQKNEIAKGRARRLHLDNAAFVTGDIRVLEAKHDLGRFDQIICFETIEHIMNDEKLVRDMAHLLRPGGRLLLTTPYKYCRRLSTDAISETEDGGHVRWGYTFAEMERLFAGAGLTVTSEDHLTGPLSQLLIRIQRALKPVHPVVGWLVVLPFRGVVALDPLLAKVTKYPSLSIALVGRRD